MSNRFSFDELLLIRPNAELCAEEILSSIRSRVRSWAEKELDNLDTPTYLNFIREYPEYRNEAWRSTIENEIERTVWYGKREAHERESFGIPFAW